jgi:hypothetical protein
MNLPPKYVPKEDPLSAALGRAAASRPPRYTPKYPANLDLCFAANPFDERFIKDNAGRDLKPLGVLTNIWFWFKHNEAEVGPAFKPIAGAIRQVLMRECPDTLTELESHEQAAPEARPG